MVAGSAARVWAGQLSEMIAVLLEEWAASRATTQALDSHRASLRVCTDDEQLSVNVAQFQNARRAVALLANGHFAGGDTTCADSVTKAARKTTPVRAAIS